MKQQLLIAFLMLLSIQAFAQDKKWSVEANYTIIHEDRPLDGTNVIELGLKYRFVNFIFANLGVSFNGGF